MHPVDDREDQNLVLQRDGDGSYFSSESITDGVWLAEVHADVGLEKPFRETLRVHVVGGARQ
jgi:nitrogen fixation protein FixH